jgi:hypothetical protein
VEERMLEFCDTEKTTGELKALLKGVQDAWLVVSYWGEGAESHLGIDETGPFRPKIICNLESGACNPHVISRLIKSKCEVWSNPKLHAKVFWNPNRAIVGSSNLSANGLGFEGSQVRSNIEANLVTSDPGTVQAIRRWIDTHACVGADKVVINSEHFRKCREAWERRQKSRHDLVVGSRNKETIWTKLTSDPKYFDNLRIRLWIYETKTLPRESKQALAKIKKQTRIDDLEQWWLGRKLRNIRPGDMIIDFGHENCRLVEGAGNLWKIFDPAWQDLSRGYNLLARPANEMSGLIYRGTKQHLATFVEKRLKKNRALNEDLTLSKVARLLSP